MDSLLLSLFTKLFPSTLLLLGLVCSCLLLLHPFLTLGLLLLLFPLGRFFRFTLLYRLWYRCVWVVWSELGEGDVG
jgi:hypothetical protein